MNSKVYILIISLLSIYGIKMNAQEKVPVDIMPIESPFPMPQLKRPSFPNRIVNIAEAGAKQNVPCTTIIQKSINALAQKGGGTICIPKGKWISGRITLKSNIELRIEEGAELHFSGNVDDYQPAVLTRYEGIDLYSLGAMIYACNAENIAVTGKGKLIAPSRNCEISQRQAGGVSEDLNHIPLSKRVFRGLNGETVFMPVFFGPVNCKNILVEGVTFEHSIFWNISPVYCENIIIRDIRVNSYGAGRTDGIDIDSSCNVLIEYVTLDCGDDCFVLKAGRGLDGIRKNQPTENIVIRHCRAIRGVGGIAIGSETAAMIRNVYVHDCLMEQVNFGVFMKTRRPRGGGAENIIMERVHIKEPRHIAFYWDMLGSKQWVGELAERFPIREINKLTPKFSNMFFKDMTVGNCQQLIKATGLPESPIENVVFENLTTNNKIIETQDVSKLTIK